jgi:hypothetical protein
MPISGGISQVHREGNLLGFLEQTINERERERERERKEERKEKMWKEERKTGPARRRRGARERSDGD